jgi:hypothetical protein
MSQREKAGENKTSNFPLTSFSCGSETPLAIPTWNSESKEAMDEVCVDLSLNGGMGEEGIEDRQCK